MPRKSKRRGRQRKRRANAGSFQKGPDPRRHVFTASDCRVGWLVANIKHPELREWLRMRLYVFYSRKERTNGEKEVGGGRSASAAERNGDGNAGQHSGCCESDAPF